jgi:hypothetical protein
MESVFSNGGFIGKTFDFADTERYVVGETTGLATLQYVGGRTGSAAGTTSNLTIGLTTLTGGTNSSPQAGDLVIVSFVTNPDDTNQISYRIAGFTQIANLYSVDTEQVQLQVGYKIMGSTPDNGVVITGGTGDADQAAAIAIQVWRNVDPTTPFDVTSTTSTSTNTVDPNPPSITPVTSGAVIVVAGGGGHATTGTFTSGDLTNFLTVNGSDTHDATVGMGSYNWTSGTFDPVLWGFTGSDSTAYAAAAVTMALRPATALVPVFGNQKNSGIWLLQNVYDLIATPTIYSNNVHPQPTDIFAWTGTSSLFCTLSRDTISSPFNNTPLKMAVTGNDPQTNTYNSSTWNIAPAANGQTWQIRVFCRADTTTTMQIFMFGANSSGSWTNSGGDISALTYDVSTEWREYVLEYTFANANIAHIQTRLDGPDTGGTGQNLWFDGLQVRRIS